MFSVMPISKSPTKKSYGIWSVNVPNRARFGRSCRSRKRLEGLIVLKSLPTKRTYCRHSATFLCARLCGRETYRNALGAQ